MEYEEEMTLEALGDTRLIRVAGEVEQEDVVLREHVLLLLEHEPSEAGGGDLGAEGLGILGFEELRVREELVRGLRVLGS